MIAPNDWAGIAAAALPWAAALALTLALAAWLTPRAWWRRPNLRALAVVAAGTLGLATLFGAVAGPRSVPAPSAAPLQHATPAAGAAYRVVDELNLRDGTGTGARRLRVLAPGTLVTATGESARDWWRVRTRLDGRDVEGWASSLWLRRADEGRAR